jgi:hypothetical protein
MIGGQDKVVISAPGRNDRLLFPAHLPPPGLPWQLQATNNIHKNALSDTRLSPMLEQPRRSLVRHLGMEFMGLSAGRNVSQDLSVHQLE